ncbi:hypothetical protein [Nitrosopumilus sp.]|uniref:hypothetical protein n=1 Tax=Nitrosopumilus sp. TaxID=2024843 RepID=UPI002610A398|nr:hypothetical protein [Nitrosopumilus sp.]
MAFKIKYKFDGDAKYSVCTVTYSQYKNFQKLPIVKKCEVIRGNVKNIENYKKEMQNALNLAFKNDTSHIKKLSEEL